MEAEKTPFDAGRHSPRNPVHWKRYIEEQVRKKKPLNGLQLADTDLSGLLAEGANFRESNFQGSRFQNARLVGVNFENADLRNANFTGADLRNAILRGARMERANFSEAELSGAILDKGNLYRCNLESAKLIGAKLTGCAAQRSNFFDANLEGANLSTCDLREANLECANLHGTDFHGANLAFIQFNALTTTLGILNIREALRVPSEFLQIVEETGNLDRNLPATLERGAETFRVRAVTDLRPGDIIGNAHEYEVIRKIGRGGCATVYLVRDLQDTRTPFKALKILDPRLRADQVQVQRFQREGQICRKISHPNVIKVFDVGLFAEFDTYYMLMSYVDGVDLGKIFRKHRDQDELFPPLKGIKIIFQICNGLAVIHSNKVIHRDLKPGNILIKRDGSVVITDFGLSRVVEPQEEISALTAPGTVLGTFAYMAPEQLVNANVDERADVYSLGVIMYEMFTGKRPFSATTILGWANVIRNRVPERPSLLVNNFPTWLESIILTCLEKRPDSRYSSIPDLIEALKSKQP